MKDSDPLKNQKLRESNQLRIGYALGWLCNGANLVYLLVRLVQAGNGIVDLLDATNFGLVLAFTPFVLWLNRADLKSPKARTWYAYLTKILPQCFMFVRIDILHKVPAAFWPIIIFGHVLIYLRGIKGHLSYYYHPDTSTKAQLISEWGNSLSWWLVTYAYWHQHGFG